MDSRLRILLAASVAWTAGCASAPAPALPAPAPEAPAPDASSPVTEGADFVVYRADGSESSLAEILDAVGAAEAVLLGEEHDDAIGHRVQYRIFTGAHARYGGSGPMIHPTPDGTPVPSTRAGGRSVVLSLEMFERDVQYVVDEYLADLITPAHFGLSSRPWGNYETDYAPLVEYAKVHSIPVVAANAPRRYVNRAGRLGPSSLDELSGEARRHLPPLPYPAGSAAYRAEWDALMGGAPMHGTGDPFDAQTLWDASMGHAVATAIDAHPDALVVHLAGGFHVENRTGTPEAVDHYRPGTRQLVIAIRSAPDPAVFTEDRAGLGDFVVLTRAPEE